MHAVWCTACRKEQEQKKIKGEKWVWCQKNLSYELRNWLALIWQVGKIVSDYVPLV